MVANIWNDDETTAYTNELIDQLPIEDQLNTRTAIRSFLQSLNVKRLDIKQTGERLAPHYNVYADGTKITSDEIWASLRKFLADRAYTSPMQDPGTTNSAPFDCGICHGVDHPRGMCPFPDREGWNGPKHRNTATERGRGGRPKGTEHRTYGTRLWLK